MPNQVDRERGAARDGARAVSRWLRGALLAGLASGWVLAPGAGRGAGVLVAVVAVAWAAITVGAEMVLATTSGRAGRALRGVQVVTDGLFLVIVSDLAGGVASPVSAIVVVYVVAVTLLASRRVGLAVTAWITALLLGVTGAAAAGLSFVPVVGEGAAGHSLGAVVTFLAIAWAATLLTAALAAPSASGEAAVAADLATVTRLSGRVSDLGDAEAIAAALVSTAIDDLGARGAVLLAVDGDVATVLAGAEHEGGVPGHGIVRRVLDERRTGVLAGSEATAEPALAALLPEPVRVAVLPLHANGGAIGVLAVDHAARPGSADERRLVTTLERCAAQVAPALVAASLLGEVQRLAETDALTSVANRRSFETALDRNLARSLVDGDPVSLVMVDLDHFRRLNEAHGHQVGDTVLASVAHALREACRPTDTVGRYGGEEFGIVLPGLDAVAAMEVAERLRRTVQETIPELGLTASFGVATAPDHGQDRRTLVAAASGAVGTSKTGGRDRCTLAA